MNCGFVLSATCDAHIFFVTFSYLSLIRLLVLGSIVLGTFLLFFFPFLPSLGQTLHRIFPFARGLYEDKVANVWCASSLIVKWHLWFKRETMATASLACTLLSFLPSCVHVFLRPSRKSFLYTLGVCAWSFYLFSFQVHEKSVLLPLLPLALLLPFHPLLYSLSGVIGVFSMYPLLEKDGQGMAYGSIRFFFGLQTLAYARGRTNRPLGKVANNFAGRIVVYAHGKLPLLVTLAQISSLVTVAMHAVWSLVPIPARYPDLLVMVFMCYSAAHFCMFYAVLLVNQWAIPEEETEDEMLQQVGPLVREGKKKG